MKRIAILPMTVLALIGVACGILHAGAKVVVKEIITVTVDKATVRTDVPPINVKGHTLVPVRGIFNAFGADIDWFPAEKRVYVREDSQVIWLRIGDAQAKVNDAMVPMDVPAMIYHGRTMVPLRFIAESLGANVNWNPDTQTITITTKGKATTVPDNTPTVEPPQPEY